MRGLFAIVIGLGGLLILLWLGSWQVQRLAWKQDLLAAIDARIADAPVDLPANPDPEADRYLPVTVSGRVIGDAPQRMLASRRTTGAVHRVIVPFETSHGRKILIDAGWQTADRAMPAFAGDTVTLTGNLDWPRETDGFTPEPDLTQGLWYARDANAMAKALETDPILLVLRDVPQTDWPVTPWPVDTAAIPNDHLQYAITWFSLAAIWAAMTLTFLLRTARGRKES